MQLLNTLVESVFAGTEFRVIFRINTDENGNGLQGIFSALDH